MDAQHLKNPPVISFYDASTEPNWQLGSVSTQTGVIYLFDGSAAKPVLAIDRKTGIVTVYVGANLPDLDLGPGKTITGKTITIKGVQVRDAAGKVISKCQNK